MVNNYIRELKETGLIHMSGDTNRTVRYHLTPKGRVTLMQTLLGYSAEIVQLYAAVKREVGAILQRFYDEDIRTVVLYGVAETAEVVYAALKQTPLVVIGVVDSDSSKHGQLFDGYPVQAPEAIEKIIPDAVIITSFAKQEEIYASLNEHVGADIKVRKLSDPQKGALCAF